jgi:hypothetical protein
MLDVSKKDNPTLASMLLYVNYTGYIYGVRQFPPHLKPAWFLLETSISTS